MRVYHGSNLEIVAPDTKHSRKAVDFGQGFYVTPLYEQAKSWCRKFKNRGDSAILSIYELNDNFIKYCKILQFDGYNEQWLDFIVLCRKELDSSDYDVVIGGVANDKVFNTVELYFDGLIDKKETIKRLRYEKANLQICFRKQDIIERYLKFIGSEKL